MDSDNTDSIKVSFTKMQGLGNDYLFIEDLDPKNLFLGGDTEAISRVSRKMSHRNFGVGSDGIALIQLSNHPEAHFKMRLFNADGSEAEMCGNGIRGFAKYVYDRKLISKFGKTVDNLDFPTLIIETLAGLRKCTIKEVKPTTEGKIAFTIRVDMGEPFIPTPYSHNLEVEGITYSITRVHLGVPHCVLFVDNFDFDYRTLGQLHSFFPNKTNVDFAKVQSTSEVSMRVWERGSGETLACGTGACAVAVACILLKESSRKLVVKMAGGNLDIEWDAKTSHVFMTGTSKEVFSGTMINWKRRWFVLSGGVCKYYIDEDGFHLKGMMNINANSKVENDNKRGPRSFTLYSEGTEYLLEAETTSEKESWKKAFEEAVAQNLNNDPNSRQLNNEERDSINSDHSSNSSHSFLEPTMQEFTVSPKMISKHLTWRKFLPPPEIILSSVPPIFEANQRKMTILDKLIKPKLENSEEDLEQYLSVLQEEQEDIQWIEDAQVFCALYKLRDGQWKLIDEGCSSMIIFHEGSSPINHRLIVFSLSHEFLINTLLSKVTFRSLFPDFVSLNIQKSKVPEVYSLSFLSEAEWEKFNAVFTSITSKARSLSIQQENEPEIKRSNSIKMKRTAIKQPPRKQIGLSHQYKYTVSNLASNTLNSTTSLVKEAIMSLEKVPSSSSSYCEATLDSILVFFLMSRANTTIPKSDPFEMLVESVINKIRSTPTVGSVEKQFLKAAVRTTKMETSNLLQQISNESIAVRSIATQISAEICLITFDKQKQKSIHFTRAVNAIAVLARNFLSSLKKLLDSIETLKLVHISRRPTVIQDILNFAQFEFEGSPPVENSEQKAEEGEENSSNEKHNKEGYYTVDELVLKVISSPGYDGTFLQTFVSTYRSFTDPYTLFENYHDAAKGPDKRVLQLRVGVFLKYWVNHHTNDFDEDLIQQLFDFILLDIQKDGYKDLVATLTRMLKNKIQERKAKIKLQIESLEPIVISEGLSGFNLLIQSKSSLIAQQLCLIDKYYYTEIGVSELLNQSWNKPALKHRSPNVLAIIHRSTKLSYWVATMILLADNITYRVRMLDKMICIALDLVDLNNFHSFTGIMAGLNLSPTYRLKQAFSKLSEKQQNKYAELMELVSTNSSFKAYRDLFKNSKAPAIPFIGVHLTDLTFIEDGNPDEEDGAINFKKREKVFTTIREVLKFQSDSYPFEKVEPLYTFLQELPCVMDEDILFNLSLHWEPRMNNVV